MKKILLIISSITGLLIFTGCHAELDTPHIKVKDNNVRIQVLNEKYEKNPVLEKKGTNFIPAWKDITVKKNAIYVTGKYPIVNSNKYDNTLLLAVNNAKLKLALFVSKNKYEKIKRALKKDDLKIKTLIYNSVLYSVPVNYNKSTCKNKVCYVQIIVNRSLMNKIIFDNLRAEYPQYAKTFDKILFDYWT